MEIERCDLKRLPPPGIGRLGSKAMIAAYFVWIFCAFIGFAIILGHDFQYRTNRPFSFSDSEDSKTISQTAKEGLTIHVGIHPKCPCTFKTLEELKRLSASATELAKCKFWIYQPPEADATWSDTRSLAFIKTFPDAEIIFDRDAEIASRLGITTSGGIVVHDCMQRVLFSGGIVLGRSCSGESIGAVALSALLKGQVNSQRSTPVFGCPIAR